jgi:hypothetical protein
MTVFISLELDDFERVFQQQVSGSRAGNGGRYGAGKSVNVRRPVRGLEVKDDTYAMVKVVDAAGNELPLFDSGGPSGRSTQYANFLLQSVQDARMEKEQIVETFGDPYIFFFGEKPRFIDIQAVLINSLDFNWHAEWWYNYENYLRGTKLTEMGARLYLFYDDVIVEGYMLSSTAVLSQDQPLFVTMNFRLFVTNYTNISITGSDYYPIRASSQLFTSVDLTAADSSQLLTPTQPDQPIPQNVLNEQAYLALLQQTGSTQLDQELQKISTQEELTAAQQSIAAQDAISAAQGFGGGGLLTAMLQAGLTSASFPAQNIDTFVNNVTEAFAAAMESAFGGPQPDPGLVRQLPLRGKITDNTDEYLSWVGGDTQSPGVALPTQQSPGVFGPVGGDTEDIVDELNRQSCMRGCQLDPSNFYNFGVVPYSPGQGFVTGGAYGRPSGAGGAFAGAGVSIGGGVGVSAGAGVTGTIGTPYSPGAAGGVGLGVGGGIGGSADLINILRSNGQSGFFGGSFGGPGSPSGVGVVPGVGYGYGQRFGTGFSASAGFTAGVGGASGGGMGGSFGPGVGGGLGGWGSSTYGNPQFRQAGNPLVQNFLQSPYGQPTGTPFGLPVTSAGPNTQNVYAFTAGIRPDGRLQAGASASFGVGASVGGGFGATTVASPPTLFDGSAGTSAVASFGAGISGDGAFGMQAVAGNFDPTLQGGGNEPCNYGY